MSTAIEGTVSAANVTVTPAVATHSHAGVPVNGADAGCHGSCQSGSLSDVIYQQVKKQYKHELSQFIQMSAWAMPRRPERPEPPLLRSR
jgi:hypothetical protein